MKSVKFHALLIGLVTLVIASCSSGKKALQNGDYDKAVFTAINRLKNNPNKQKAVFTLAKGYDYALNRHLERINDIKLTNDIFKWERIVTEYQQINYLANAIRNCPACIDAVPDTEKYIAEVSDAKYFAAEARYNNGQKLLSQNNRLAAKQAYFDFEKAEQLYPDFKNAQSMIDSAYFAAVIRVVVEPVQVNSRFFKLSNEYFQNKIYEFMKNYETRSFVQFFTPDQALDSKLRFDHVITLSFDDFVVGQTYVKERIEDITRDSIKTDETRDSLKRPIYTTAKGKLTTFEKSITSTGLLDFQIKDMNGVVITQEKMPGTFVWLDTWGGFRGDERALTEQDKALLNRRESYPPPPQDMFIEFTKPIYSQLISKVRNFYSRY
jgi:hypothetical protein